MSYYLEAPRWFAFGLIKRLLSLGNNMLLHNSALRLPGYSHKWLRTLSISHSGHGSQQLARTFRCKLLDVFHGLGMNVQARPDNSTDVLLSHFRLGEVVSWKNAPLLSARRQLNVKGTLTVLAVVQTTAQSLRDVLNVLNESLSQSPYDPSDVFFPGLKHTAYRPLCAEAATRGPLLAFARIVQAQLKCFNVILLLGDTQIECAYLFNLVGSQFKVLYGGHFYYEMALRIATMASTNEVTNHELVGTAISRKAWERSEAVRGLCRASREFGKRSFFSGAIVVSELVDYPVIARAVASRYSEGCFSTWDPILNGLVITMAGARHVYDKTRVAASDLVLAVKCRREVDGVCFRQVAGQKRPVPSSEAFEFLSIDSELPHASVCARMSHPVEVPIIRSKIHGHRGISAFDPTIIEYAPLPQAFQEFPTCCATDAQAFAVRQAFGNARSFFDPTDRRRIVFTILPGHGVLIVEKWVEGKRPFQVIWEAIDCGRLEVSACVPQHAPQFIRTTPTRFECTPCLSEACEFRMSHVID